MTGGGRALCAAVVLLALAVAVPARAAETPRRGSYINLTLGPAYTTGSVDYSDNWVSFDDSFSGFGAAARFAVGYAAADGLAFAVALEASLSDGEIQEPDGTESVFSATSVGALADWYPNPSGAPHFELGVGYVATGFHAADKDLSSAPGASGLGAGGIIGSAAAGYAGRWSSGFGMGPLLRVSGLHTSNTVVSTSAFTVALLVELTWF